MVQLLHRQVQRGCKIFGQVLPWRQEATACSKARGLGREHVVLHLCLLAFLLEPGVLSDLRERDSPGSEQPGMLHRSRSIKPHLPKPRSNLITSRGASLDPPRASAQSGPWPRCSSGLGEAGEMSFFLACTIPPSTCPDYLNALAMLAVEEPPMLAPESSPWEFEKCRRSFPYSHCHHQGLCLST